MLHVRVIEFYVENIENKSKMNRNVTAFMLSKRTEVTNWENSVCVVFLFVSFLTWNGNVCIQNRFVVPSNSLANGLNALFLFVEWNGERWRVKSTWQPRYEHEAYSQFLIEKLVQRNSPRYNLVTSGKKGSNNVHLIIASHNFASSNTEKETSEWN